MTDNTQPEALDLADWLEAVGGAPSAKRCAALMREQYAHIIDLEAQLAAIGAGGVSGPLLGGAALAEPQQAASAVLRQSLLDPENQPNQYGVEFGMSGPQMHFKIDNQLFKLAYEPDDEEEFEFMKRMLINAFSVFTPDVKAAPQQEVQEPNNFGAPATCDSPALCSVSRVCAGQFGTKRLCKPAIWAAQPAPSGDAEDAARYRWLRTNAIGAFRTNNGNGPVSVYHLSKIPALPGISEETNAAIDAARKEGK